MFHIGCVCCWLFVALSSQIQVQVQSKGWVIYSNIRGLHANLDEWLWLDQIVVFWFVLRYIHSLYIFLQNDLYHKS